MYALPFKLRRLCLVVHPSSKAVWWSGLLGNLKGVSPGLAYWLRTGGAPRAGVCVGGRRGRKRPWGQLAGTQMLVHKDVHSDEGGATRAHQNLIWNMDGGWEATRWKHQETKGAVHWLASYFSIMDTVYRCVLVSRVSTDVTYFT